MKGVWKLLTIFMFTAALLAQYSIAAEQQPAATTPSPAVSTDSGRSYDDFRDWFHNPTDWLSMGADYRFRWVNGWNLDTLNSDATRRNSGWNFLRNRMRWWTKTKINDDMDFNLKLTWEFRSWDGPERKSQQVDFDEIMFDQFNLTVRNLFDAPLTMVAGRQDIFLGEGWLICDANPLDGSRTAFFDALRFTYKPNDNVSLDMIYIENRASQDAYLKPINDRHRQGTEQDERAIIIYLTDKSRSNMNLEGYFIYKNDNPINYNPTDPHDIWPAFRSPAYWSRKAEIYTIGGAMSGKIADSEHWKYRMEGAFQVGRKETLTGCGLKMQDLQAFGTVDRIEYHFNDAKKNKLRGSFEFLSGDDPDTSKNEAFDPLWGEWPRVSEILSYSYNLETMIGEVTNLYRLGLGHSIQLTEKLSMDTDYHMLWADENTVGGTAHSSGLAWSQNSRFRGHLGTMWFKYQFTKQFKGHILLEYFSPGNYYESSSRDAAYFARLNLEYTF
ncbi:MAG: hypothetical protein WC496_08930 [Phycisphaerae bacterium]|jgi:hypothetical protein